jgi:hypothetical protein
VTEKQPVKAGQIIGIIDNPASFNDILKLELYLDSIKPILYTPEEFVFIDVPEELILGQIQNFYSAFSSQWTEYLNLVKYDLLGQQIKSISNQVYDYQKYLILLKDQVEVLRIDLRLSEKQLRRDSILYSQKVMSESQYEQSLASYYKQKYSFKNAFSNLSSTQIKINQLEQQILELRIQDDEKKLRSLRGLKEHYENLIAQIEIWKQTFVLDAPIDGIITFTELWSVNQFVNVGSIAFTIVPEKEQQIIGRLVMPINGSGKVEKGHKLYIKLDNFPFMEYGLIEGSIISTSMVPVNSSEGSFYIAKVRLSNGLTTNYNISLPFSQEMQGNVEIITKDRRLIERFVEPLRMLLTKNI